MNRDAHDARTSTLIGKMLDGTITEGERSEFHHLQADFARSLRAVIPERLRRLRERQRAFKTERGN